MTVTANNFVSVQNPGRCLVEFVGTTDATLTPKNLYVAGANYGTLGVNGSDVWGLIAVNNGTTAHNVTLQINNNGGTVLAQINTVAVAANAGNNGTVTPVALMAAAVAPGYPVDDNGNPYIRLNNGDTLSAKYATAQGTAETLSLYGLTGDY